MPIVIEDLSGLSKGIETAGGALAKALEKRAGTRLKGALGDVIGDANFTSPQGSRQFLGDYQAAGGDIKDGLAIAKASSGSGSRSSEDRRTYNENQKLVAGIASDQRKIAPLLKQSDAIEKAIRSKNLPGSGTVGDVKAKWNAFWNQTSKEVQLLSTMAKRTIIEMGDTKGMRLTDTKLKFLQESLFNPHKSPEENEEAYRLWKETLGNYKKYGQAVSSILENDANALYDPTLSTQISDWKSPDSGSEEQEEVMMEKPSPKGRKGQILTNQETGEREISNDSKWVKVR